MGEYARHDMKVKRAVNSIMSKQGWAKDKEFFRAMGPLFIVGKNANQFLIEGNPCSTVAVSDPYNGISRTRASALPEPGINVTDYPSMGYRHHERLFVKIKLFAILDAGGLPYPDVGSTDRQSWYLTIPRGKTIPVEIVEGSTYLANIGVAVNEIERRIGGEIDLYEWNFRVKDWDIPPFDAFRAVFQKKLDDTHFVQSGGFHYNVDGQILRILEIPQEKNGGSIVDASILNILLKHPDISEIILPGNILQKVDVFLRGISGLF